MRQQFDGFQVRAADDPPSALAVVLDTAVSSWIQATNDISPLSAKQAANALQTVTEQLLVFLNTFLLQHDANRVYVLLVSTASCQMVYPALEDAGRLPPAYDVTIEDDAFDASSTISSQRLPVNPGRAMDILREAVIAGVKSSVEEQCASNAVRDGSTLVSTALARGLCLLNRGRKLRADRAVMSLGKEALIEGIEVDVPSNGRLLAVLSGVDSPHQYVGMMSCMFSAQRIGVPIDSCLVSKQDSTYLQQAAHLTQGVYVRVARDASEVSDIFLQTLQTVFLADRQSRDFIAMPAPDSVDFRASCMQTRKIIEDGYTCSVCLSTFGKEVKGAPLCPICNARFAVPPRTKRRPQ